MIERQLSKEGLADIVDDKEQINQFSTSGNMLNEIAYSII